MGYSIKRYKGKLLKEGIFLCVKNRLYIEGYANLNIYQNLLVGTESFWSTTFDLSRVELFIIFGNASNVIGCFMSIPYRQKSVHKRRGYLASIFIKPNYRRRGIGTLLIEYAKSFSTRKKFHAQTSRGEGHAFYTKVGITCDSVD